MDPLDNLASVTKEADAENPSPEQQQQQQAEQEQQQQAQQGAQDWAQIPMMIGSLLCQIEPALAPVYTEKKCLAWGAAANATAEKYGWAGPSSLPELALVVSTAMMVIPSFVRVRQRIAMLKEAKDGGVFASVMLWWRERKRAKGEAKARTNDNAPGDARVQEVAL